MAMGRRESERQTDFWVPTASLPQSPGHPFYEQVNDVLACGSRELRPRKRSTKADLELIRYVKPDTTRIEGSILWDGWVRQAPGVLPG